MLPERLPSPDLVLPQARLRFVNAERAGAADWRAELFGVETLLVQSVTRFMQSAEERLVEEARVVARCQTAIARPEARAERMCRHVEPAGLEVEADGRCRRLAEQLLTING